MLQEKLGFIKMMQVTSQFTVKKFLPRLLFQTTPLVFSE